MKEMLRLLPDLARMIGKIVLDPALPRAAKLALAAAAIYLVSPVDLIPDFIPLAGILDDVLLAGIVVDGLLSFVDRKLILKYWPGTEASLDRLAGIARRMAAWVPRRLKARVFSGR